MPKLFNSLKTSVLTLLIVVVMLVLVQLSTTLLKSFLVVDDSLTHAEALVVMAGSQEERLPAAAHLFKKGMAPKILLANDGVSAAFSQARHRNLYQVEWAEEELVKLGVPLEKIVKLPFYGSATIFDVLAVKKHLLQNGLEKIIVVTSDYHTRRTAWTFRYALKGHSVNISVFPARSYSVSSKGIVMEYVKLGYYLIKFGLLDLMPDIHEVNLRKAQPVKPFPG